MPHQKPLLMIQTRYVNRPLHVEFRRSLMNKSWNDTPADFAVVMHGTDMTQYQQDWAMVERATSAGMVKYRLRFETDGRLPPFLYEVLTWAMELGYKYVGVFDDDGYYTHTDDAATDIVTAFDTDHSVGCVGPMGGMRKFRRFENKPAFLEPLHRCPWACLGSQIYRVDALRSIDLAFLKDLKFRADAIISMLLYGTGWGNYEMDLPFMHALSAGLDRKVATAEFHQQRMAQVEHDYIIYRDVIQQQIEPMNPIIASELYGELPKLRRAEYNHNRKKYEKLSQAEEQGQGTK